MTIPVGLNDSLVDRLARTPDERHRNWLLFHFLAYRANNDVFARLIEQCPDVLTRDAWGPHLTEDNPKLNVVARAHGLGLLPYSLREAVAAELEYAAKNDLDLSFFDNDAMLLLVPPLRLIQLALSLRSVTLPEIEDRIEKILEDADLDEAPESHFENVLAVLDRLESMGVDPDAEALIEDARSQVERSVATLEERKEERDKESDDDDTDWTHIVTQAKDTSGSKPKATGARSIFDDVDQ